jgi:hypothetical protein
LAGSDRCLYHAAATDKAAHRQRQLLWYGRGWITEAQWLAAEAKRMRNKINNQRRPPPKGRPNAWMLPGITVRFGPEIEAQFQQDAAPVLSRAAMFWQDLPDLHRDKLRWAWRRFSFDRPRPEAWAARATAVMLDLAARGEYLPELLTHDDGLGDHCIVVTARPNAFSKRTKITQAEVARAFGAPAKATREAKAAAVKAAKAAADAQAPKATAAKAKLRAAEPPAVRAARLARKAATSRAARAARWTKPNVGSTRPMAAIDEAAGPADEDRAARRHALHRDAHAILAKLEGEHPEAFDIEAALNALEAQADGATYAWVNFMTGLRGGGRVGQRSRRAALANARRVPGRGATAFAADSYGMDLPSD